jgi:ribosomal protein L11 methyltransferase
MLPMWRWTRMTSVKWEDSWAERLSFLGAERVVFISWPGSRGLKVEAFGDEKTVKALVKRFGGKAAKALLWTGDPVKPRAPLSIRGRLKVFSEETDYRVWMVAGRNPPAIFIPAGMAFGTGEHATTAGCLRFLCDAIEANGGLPDRVLDVGTGSGILAIAAARLGARAVDAFDYDPDSIRVAKQNVRANACKNVRVSRADLLEWGPTEAYDIVLANVFSELLIRTASILSRATRRGGRLIFSGVLEAQLDEVTGALARRRLRATRTIVRGKWCAGICEKAG